jgi:outer membrane murein-binding lipoprotein Lpp
LAGERHSASSCRSRPEMTGTTQLYRHSQHRIAPFCLAASCASLLLLSGCAERQVKAKPFPWSTYAYTRPLSPDTSLARNDDSDDPLADATPEIAPPPSALVIARNAPARPRVPVVNSSQNDSDSKPDVPQIAPQLTVAEANAAQQQTTQSLSVAERNIGSAEGKTLNATQQDLASKVRSFMAEAHEAAKSGDWTRAKNAAKKAEVLSQELASSL